ncbi:MULTISPECIES: hypothetical protein [Acidianus]|uniref:Uncharacterized protein n=1 Tax=Candidatus Acidianus copahuensis TaxID=1160895 RepID=A0A031LN51_9CREN|nr:MULTISPECIES: hypothetical protein [Acidianus]EZQ04825.1 hypothetical protein CM19_07525 [Candidatus Acidianus copahuensis]NON62781.1 hypothetical protein [Acidianus sp. RZ1]
MRSVMKGRDLEGLVFLGKVSSVNVEFCDEEKKKAKVLVKTTDGDEVESECIPIRAAGKISTVIKHYLKLGIGNHIITEGTQVSNVDVEGEDETEDRQDS